MSTSRNLCSPGFRFIYNIFSFVLFCLYAFDILPLLPSVALTGSPALRNFLIATSILGGTVDIALTMYCFGFMKTFIQILQVQLAGSQVKFSFCFATTLTT